MNSSADDSAAVKTILIVDDEHDILDLIEYNLERHGYQVLKTDNGSDGLYLAKKFLPDLIILDIMMPKMDGHEVCRLLKKEETLARTPVVFLTARSDEKTEIKGLDQGADDYLTKPISISKLLSRIKAILRRTDNQDSSSEQRIVTGDLEIDRNSHLVYKQSVEIRLPKKEFELLYYLASNAGKVISRQALLNNIWGSHVYVIDRTIDVHIRKIREKIGSNYIETVKGVGYRFKK